MTAARARTLRAATIPASGTFLQTMRRLLLLAALAALAVAAAPAAGATWTAPQTVSTPHTFAGPLVTATTGRGALVAAWPWQDNVGNDARGGEAIAIRPPGAAAFGPEAPALDGLVDLEPYATDQTLGLAAQGLPGRSGATGALLYRIRVSFNNGPARTLATVPLIGRPQLATAAGSTTALVTWIEVTRTSSGAIRRVVRAVDRRHGRWGRAYTLSGRGRADTITAAGGPRGDEVVAFVRQGRLLARMRRTGHGWGSLQELARATGPTQWQLASGVNLRGQMRVVWRRHQLRQSGTPGRTALESAARLVGRGTFTAAQTLTPDGVSATLHLIELPDGWAVATVEAAADGPRPAVHRTPPGGASRFQPVVYAAPARGGLRAADASYDAATRELTVAWIQPLPGQDGDGQALAATLPAGATAFGPIEEVSPPEAAHEVRLLQPPGVLGAPVALWTARPEGTGPSIPIGQVRTVVRAAQRQP
jgi:hypothetical protein